MNKLLQASEAARKAQENMLETSRLREETEAENRKIKKSKENLLTQSALEAKAIIKKAQEKASEIISEADKYLQSNPQKKNAVRSSVKKMGKDLRIEKNKFINIRLKKLKII